jgi:hypothetical protein
VLICAHKVGRERSSPSVTPDNVAKRSHGGLTTEDPGGTYLSFSMELRTCRAWNDSNTSQLHSFSKWSP